MSSLEPGTDAVALVHWPSDRAGRDELAALRRPRVLLVAADAAAPVVTDVEEDWLRLPASPEDVRARIATVAARSVPVFRAETPIEVSDGRLTHDGRSITLTPIEEHLLSALAAEPGRLVTLDRLVGDGGIVDTVNAVRVHVMRLRKRLGTAGLNLRTVHGRGYVLERGRDV